MYMPILYIAVYKSSKSMQCATLKFTSAKNVITEHLKFVYLSDCFMKIVLWQHI